MMDMTNHTWNWKPRQRIWATEVWTFTTDYKYWLLRSPGQAPDVIAGHSHRYVLHDLRVQQFIELNMFHQNFCQATRNQMIALTQRITSAGKKVLKQSCNLEIDT